MFPFIFLLKTGNRQRNRCPLCKIHLFTPQPIGDEAQCLFSVGKSLHALHRRVSRRLRRFFQQKAHVLTHRGSRGTFQLNVGLSANENRPGCLEEKHLFPALLTFVQRVAQKRRRDARCYRAVGTAQNRVLLFCKIASVFFPLFAPLFKISLCLVPLFLRL